MTARWAAAAPPTIDEVAGGAQAVVACSGLALLFASSELEETIGLCDRVLIMYRGRAIREFAKGDATKTDVAYWVSGGDSVALLAAVEPGVKATN